MRSLCLALLCGSAMAYAPAPRPALCSLSEPPDFSVRRTRMIVRQAQVVVRAQSLGPVPPPAGTKRPDLRYVALVVREAMRGAALGDTLRFMGGADARDSFREPGEDAVPYRSYYRPSAGACIASTYRTGGEYLLLLRRDQDGELDPYWVPLAPTNDQVRGRDDPWVVWVRRELQARPAHRVDPLRRRSSHRAEKGTPRPSPRGAP